MDVRFPVGQIEHKEEDSTRRSCHICSKISLIYLKFIAQKLPQYVQLIKMAKTQSFENYYGQFLRQE
jgi:hypothetical protein